VWIYSEQNCFYRYPEVYIEFESYVVKRIAIEKDDLAIYSFEKGKCRYERKDAGLFFSN
jgi:hypothetical protein